MANATQTAYTDEQISAWLRGLLTIAWADGHYDAQEQQLISQLTQELTLVNGNDKGFQPIASGELATALGKDAEIAENFLRTAVLVAVADGIYSTPEAELLHDFSNALGLKIEALEALEHTLCKPQESPTDSSAAGLVSPPLPHPDVLKPMKDWLDGVDIQDPRIARFICKMVPSQCPFERDVTLFGRKIVHIPPLCKINPLYEQLVGLRFRSLSYLADECKEDVSEYI
jgi:tellurite resistance protein